MLHSLELIILQAIRHFYDMPWQVGMFTIGAAGIALLTLQFIKRSSAVLPGLFGVFFLVAEVAHVTRDMRVIRFLDELIGFVGTPAYGREPLPNYLEPIFYHAVGPVEFRSWFSETLLVVLVTYSLMALYFCLQDYRKTQRFFGDLSAKAFFKPKQKRPLRSKTNELGSGDLAATDQIAKWVRAAPGPTDTPVYVRGLRGSDGEGFAQTKLVFPREERNRHILCVAKTGGGKTTKMILPILYNDCLDPVRSTIVIDSKPEMWQKLATLTKKYNPQKKILLFNPLDVARSLSWNILGKIEDETDCKLIANTIIMATDQPQSKSDSPFFRNNALALLNAIMVGLLHDDNEVLSMPRIHELVQSGMKPLCDWLEAHPHAYRTSRTFIELARSGSQNSDTIMSELSMRISAWDLPDVRATTSAEEIDLEDIISKPTLFIIELRESELEMLRPLANVLVIEVLRFLTKRAERCPGVSLPRPVGFVIDEFASSLGRLPDIHVKLNTLRSRNVSILAAIQSIAQIKANYHDDADSVLAGFSTKIFMPTLDIQDSEWASKETGQMTVRFKTESAGSNKKLIEFFASKNIGTQEQVQQRAVLTPDEIGRPVDNISTFFLPNMPVFQGHLIPFYEIPEMLRRIKDCETAEQLKLRTEPIKIEERLPVSPPPGGGGAIGSGAMGGGGGAASSYAYNYYADPNYLPPGITNTDTWSESQIREKLEEIKKKLDWDNTTGSARKWWEAFEQENQTRINLVLRLAEELGLRGSTITEFFLAYVYSNTDNIQANLCYLDYTRLKKEEEQKKQEMNPGAAPPPTDPNEMNDFDFGPSDFAF